MGLVETRGYVAAVEAADAMAKSAHVDIIRLDVTRDARVTVLVRGSVADVEAAVAAGSARAGVVGTLLRHWVIPAPDPALEHVLQIGSRDPGGRPSSA